MLVVYGHALRGTYWPVMPSSIALQDALIYAFHMPTFFVLSGLFLWSSIAKGRRNCFRNKIKTILYPYFLWSLIAGGIELAASPWVNSPITFNDLLNIPLYPIEQFWFLYALFIIQVAIVILFPNKAVVYLLGIALPLLLALVNLPAQLVQAAMYFPYVAGGIAASALCVRISESTSQTKCMWLVVSWLSFALVMITRLHLRVDGMLLLYFAGFAGTSGTIALAMLLGSSRPACLMAALGRASMAIYVLHTIVSAGTRIGLGMVNLASSATMVLIISTILGLLIPYAIYRFALHCGLAGWLGFGTELGGRPRENVPSRPASS